MSHGVGDEIKVRSIRCDYMRRPGCMCALRSSGLKSYRLTWQSRGETSHQL